MTNFYSRKAITVTLTKPDGKEFVFERAPIDCTITKTGGEVYSTANIDIYGLTLQKMNELSFTFQSFYLTRNQIIVSAGELGQKLSVIFKGEVLFSYCDLNNATPVLHIEAQTGCFSALKPTSPRQVKGEEKVQSIVSSIAESIKMTFDMTNPTDARMKDSVINGNPVSMIKSIARAVKAFVLFDDNEIVFVPNGQCRQTGRPVPVISKANGMIGYPTMTKDGVDAEMFFRPELKLGEKVYIDSIIDSAKAFWMLTNLTHTLSAFNPNNQSWNTSISCTWTQQGEDEENGV